jgi:hypothetical protein
LPAISCRAKRLAAVTAQTTLVTLLLHVKKCDLALKPFCTYLIIDKISSSSLLCHNEATRAQARAFCATSHGQWDDICPSFVIEQMEGSKYVLDARLR